MSALKSAIVWSAVAGGSLLAGRWLALAASSEVNSAILLTLGAVGALVNATSFQVLRRLDDSPAKLLSPRFAARLERKLEQRRRRFRFKWAGAVLSGVIAALCGSLLKVAALVDSHFWLTCGGYVACGLSLTLGVLIVSEYTALSKLARDLPKHLEKQREKSALLERLQT